MFLGLQVYLEMKINSLRVFQFELLIQYGNFLKRKQTKVRKYQKKILVPSIFPKTSEKDSPASIKRLIEKELETGAEIMEIYSVICLEN